MPRSCPLVLGLAALLLARAAVSQLVQFNSIEPKRTYAEASFSVVSGRNSSGHWNSKLHFSHSANVGTLEEGNATNAWKMDFDHKIEVSEEGEKIHLYATVTIPPAGSSEMPMVSGEAPGTMNMDEKLLGQDYQLAAGLGYYKFHDQPLTWYGALKTCYREYAQLAVISSEEEASALRKLFLEHPAIHGAHYDYAAFMGINDLENEGSYVTIDDVPLQDMGYLRWQDGQPNNYGRRGTPGQDCVAMTRQAEYLDVECYFKLPFICKKPLHRNT